MPESTYISKIEAICSQAKKCFENELPQTPNRQIYPKDYCEESSIILNSILKKEGIENFKLTRGTNIDNKYHFWLESDSLIIDITAHQFESISAPIILVSKNEYPLNKIFSRNIHTYPINPNWDFFNQLQSEAIESFYQNYYKLDSGL